MNIEIREATKMDIELILNLMENYYSYEDLAFKKNDSRKALIDLLSNDDYGFVDLVIINNDVVGYICVTFGFSLEYFGRDCIIDEIYIVPESRRKGIGSHVLKQLEKQLIDKGVKAIHLEVFSKNKQAYHFFLKNGFVVHESSFLSKILDGTV